MVIDCWLLIAVKAFFSILLIWLYSVFFSSGPYFGFGRYVPEGSLEMCGFDFMTQTHGVSILVNW